MRTSRWFRKIVQQCENDVMDSMFAGSLQRSGLDNWPFMWLSTHMRHRVMHKLREAQRKWDEVVAMRDRLAIEIAEDLTNQIDYDALGKRALQAYRRLAFAHGRTPQALTEDSVIVQDKYLFLTFKQRGWGFGADVRFTIKHNPKDGSVTLTDGVFLRDEQGNDVADAG